jgi:hypothetical protein
MLLKGKGGGGSGETVTQDNVYLIEASDDIAAVFDNIGFPVVVIGSSVEGVTNAQIAAHILPTAQANPDIHFLVAGVGGPIDAVAKNAGHDAAAPNRIVVMAAASDTTSPYMYADDSASGQISEFDSHIELAINSLRSMGQSGGGIGSRGLSGVSPIMASSSGITPMRLAGSAPANSQIKSRIHVFGDMTQ